jgi:type I restriction enzyme M protein
MAIKTKPLTEAMAEELALPPFSESDEMPAERAGYVRDYVSGIMVRATPEEVDAVQVFSRRLVEDFGYAKEQIRTRPQFRLKRSPSDTKQAGYPVDIAVFNTSDHSKDDLLVVVECKKKNSKEGIAQLKTYLDLSSADIGIWFNGEDHVYLRKVFLPNGQRKYESLPSIPRKGERIEDVGLYRRGDLKRPSNLKAIFRDIRNHLAGNVTGITRDEALAQEIINLLFCKIYDELNTDLAEMVRFRCGVGEDLAAVQERIFKLFDDVKVEYSDVFDPEEAMRLDAESLTYVVGELQNYSITEADRDAVGDAFEVFIGPALRGAEGQFFTPRNVVRMIMEMLNPEAGKMIIDPACGSGGFLIMALEYVWRKMEAAAPARGWSTRQLEKRKTDVASQCFRGLDKDAFLAKVTKAYMALVGDGRGGLFCENSLQPPRDWNPLAQSKIKLGQFDFLFTNPPFGSKIPVKGHHVLSQYDLGHRWTRDKESGKLVKSTAVLEDQAPQILFLERCIQLLKPGASLGLYCRKALLVTRPIHIFCLGYWHELNYWQSLRCLRRYSKPAERAALTLRSACFVLKKILLPQHL